MASFQKRGDTWQYTVSRMVHGKSRPIRKGGFKTKKEAQVAAATVETELAKGFEITRGPIIFATFFRKWIEDTKSAVAVTTKERYLNSVVTVENYFGYETIQNITKQMYKRFLDKYGQDHAKDTIRKLNIHIRACVKDAIDDGIIRTDFTRGVAYKSGIQSKKPEDKHLNYEESKRLLKELVSCIDRSPLYLLLILALQSGLRYGELLGLKRSDFDFKLNKINVERAFDYKRGSGFISLKNTQSERIVDIDEETMKLCAKYFERHPANVKGLVFFNIQSKSGTFSNNATNKILTKALERLKIDRVTVHGLRHTHISILLYRGLDVHYVSKRAGHKTIQTTLDTYAHILKEMQQEQINRAKETMNEMWAV